MWANDMGPKQGWMHLVHGYDLPERQNFEPPEQVQMYAEGFQMEQRSEAPVVQNSVIWQMRESLFVIVWGPFNTEEIHHFADWEGGGG